MEKKTKTIIAVVVVAIVVVGASVFIVFQGQEEKCSELYRFTGTWGEVYFTVDDEPVLFGEVTLYDNGTGKSYEHSLNFPKEFTYELLDDGMIRFNFSPSRLWITSSGESYIFDFTYTFNDDYTKLTLYYTHPHQSLTEQIELLKEYVFSPTSEIETRAEINMNVSETLSAIENKSSFNMSVYNPTYSLIVIRECFSLNDTSQIIGKFKREGEFFAIDLNNITESFDYCNSAALNPYEKRTYKFIIKNVEEGKYRISMDIAIMNMWSYAQEFVHSNEFTLVID